MNVVSFFTLRLDKQAALEFNILYQIKASILCDPHYSLGEKNVIKLCILILPIAGSLGSHLVLRLLPLQWADIICVPISGVSMYNCYQQRRHHILIVSVLTFAHSPSWGHDVLMMGEAFCIRWRRDVFHFSCFYSLVNTHLNKASKKVLHRGAQYIASHHQCSSR